MMDWVETLNLIAASLHGAQAITVIALIAWLDSRAAPALKNMGPFNNGGHFALTCPIPVWDRNTTALRVATLDAGSFDVRYAVVAFFTLSFVFQTTAAIFRSGRSGPILRYLEYSVSASTLLCAISVEAGIRDAYTIQAQFMLVFATMILGIAAELAQTPSSPVYPSIFFHLAGWATCLSAYVPTMDVFIQSSRLSELAPPDFVRALVFTEFALFVSFGFVQSYILAAKAYLLLTAQANGGGNGGMAMNGGGLFLDGSNEYLMPTNNNGGPTMSMMMMPVSSSSSYSSSSPYFYYQRDGLKGVDETAELIFIILSLGAKTILCWIVFTPILQAAG